MSKHTPGPWFVDPEDDGCISPEHDACVEIAMTANIDYDGNRYSYGEESQANANLIAAAPDLLQCLQWMVQLHESKPGLVSGPEYCASLAAIKKAKGESQ